MWHDDLKALVSGRTLLSRAAVDWALRRVALESALISACARTLGCSWNALDRAVRAHGMRILSRSDLYARVTRIGVDEHVWRHGAFGDRYVTVIVDLALESALISACARTLGCSWNALDRAVRAHGMRILSRSDLYARVTRIGVDEHVWRHGAFGDRYVTVIVDLTPRADGSVRPDASAPRSSCHIRAQATHS